MMTLIYGRTNLTGEIEGFSPGSSTFEINLGRGMKVLLEARGDNATQLFDKMRQSMNAVGLMRLKNSTINFNTGTISLNEGTNNVPTKKSSIKTAFVA